MPRNPQPTKKPKARRLRRSILEFRDGRPVRWCYVVPAERVTQLRRRISRNPNSQTNRALAFLGFPEAPLRRKGGK